LREAVDAGRSREDLDAVCALDESSWWQDVQPDLLYE
jgi:hypothetical protein